MLEIKDGELSGILSSTPTSPINFKLNAGESLCIYAWEQPIKRVLIDTIVGLRPLKKGYFTMDGDIIDSQSVAYFHQFLAFVPRQLDFLLETVDELLDYISLIDRQIICEQIKAEWLKFGFGDNLFEQSLNKLGHNTLQTLLIIYAVLLKRAYIVLDLDDEVMLSEQALNYLQDYLHSGGAIIMASNHESMKNFCMGTLSSPTLHITPQSF